MDERLTYWQCRRCEGSGESIYPPGDCQTCGGTGNALSKSANRRALDKRRAERLDREAFDRLGDTLCGAGIMRRVTMDERIAPDGAIWICGACGKITKDRYGTENGWDESCMLKAELVHEKMEDGVWWPFEREDQP